MYTHAVPPCNVAVMIPSVDVFGTFQGFDLGPAADGPGVSGGTYPLRQGPVLNSCTTGNRQKRRLTAALPPNSRPATSYVSLGVSKDLLMLKTGTENWRGMLPWASCALST